MTTAALANDSGGASAGTSATKSSTTTPTASPKDKQQQAENDNMAKNAFSKIGNLFPKASLRNLTQPKYTLPDKTVASQVLMYRQLLHTKCKPGLRLTRPYNATPAQKAVLHMPWWEQGIEDSGKMIISYNNLVVRLWLNGAILPHELTQNTEEVETLIDDDGLPPVPHEYWVDRLGFQQDDPVTDFRSGGVLSLALLCHIVESCPHVYRRFYGKGDAAILPFGITGINVVDMMAKFLMFSKSIDKMDALLSQKPFWKMFGDPNAILALMELSMMMMCDVVVELKRERQIPGHSPSKKKGEKSLHGEDEGNVTVFDFPGILEKTEERVRDDLLGAGPKTVDELRSIAGRLHVKYEQQLEKKERKAYKKMMERDEREMYGTNASAGGSGENKPLQMAGAVLGTAGNVAGGVWNKIRNTADSVSQNPHVQEIMTGAMSRYGTDEEVLESFKATGRYGADESVANANSSKATTTTSAPAVPDLLQSASQDADAAMKSASATSGDVEVVDFFQPTAQASDKSPPDLLQSASQDAALAAAVADSQQKPLDQSGHSSSMDGDWTTVPPSEALGGFTINDDDDGDDDLL